MPHNIMFSIVREDPSIELAIINKYIGNKPCNILTIASGGCTMFTLLSCTNINNIDAVDINCDQLYLCALKLGIIRFFNNSDDVLNFFEGMYSKNICEEILSRVYTLKYISHNTYNFWMSNINDVSYGINKIGKYEQLFRDLATSDYDFEKIFSHDNLQKNFGSKAVASTTNFVDKFKKIFSDYEKDNIETNYFYYNIVNGITDRNNLPTYLKHIHKISKVSTDKIHFITNDINNYTKEIADKTYNFINLSNVTDWMTEKDIDILFQQIYRILTENGCVVLRRLASNNNIKQIASEYFEIIDDKVYPQDSSYFNDVLCCRKI